MIFWSKFSQKCCFQSKKRKVNTTIQFCLSHPKKVFPFKKQKKLIPPLNLAYLNYSRYQISALTDNFDFYDQVCQERVFPVKNRKNEHPQWILLLINTLGTKFQLALSILIIWSKFSLKEYFEMKTEESRLGVCLWPLLTNLDSTSVF